MRCWLNFLGLLAAVAVSTVALGQTANYNLGRAPTDAEIRAWDITVSSDGKGLPPGSGTAKDGAKFYAQKCANCHGATGTEDLSTGARFPLVGGKDTLTSLHPVRTIGSYWPFATTVWDFINRAMPIGAEGSLKADEVYALTAFLLYRNGIVKESEVIDAKTLPQVEMPNRKSFSPARFEDVPLRCGLGVCP
jgi:S-disulfanyl-L-cysteine oxidoreductase SoxD